MWQLRMHCNLKQPDVATSLSGLFYPQIQPILYCHAHNAILHLLIKIGLYSDVAIRFSDPDFLKEINNLAARRRFHAVTLTFDDLTFERLQYNGSHFIKLYIIMPIEIEQSAAEIYSH